MPMTLALSCEVVHEKLWKSVNICKSYSKKISGTFFSWTRCSSMLKYTGRRCGGHSQTRKAPVTQEAAGLTAYGARNWLPSSHWSKRSKEFFEIFVSKWCVLKHSDTLFTVRMLKGFISSSFCHFFRLIPCSRTRLSWLPVSFWLNVKYIYCVIVAQMSPSLL